MANDLAPPQLSTEELNRLAAKRISSTLMYDYDQVFAQCRYKDADKITVMTQAGINYQLKKMYEAAVTKTKDLTAQVVAGKIKEEDAPWPLLARWKTRLNDKDPTSEEYDDWTQIDAEMDASRIQLLLETRNRSVLYSLRLKSGTFRYWAGRGKAQKQVSVSIKDWVLAFKADLDLQTLNQSDVPEFVKKALQHLNDYSVRQLIVDFTSTSADIASPDMQHTRLDDTLIESAKTQFKEFVTTYLQLAKKDPSHSILGTVATVNDPGHFAAAPTLAPTSLTFMNMPFIRDNGETDASGVEAGARNMLVYLQMTGPRKLPTQFLPQSANWVMPSLPGQSFKDGTVSLSKKIFLEAYFLPKLTVFNKKSSWVVDECSWYSKLLVIYYNFNGHCGFEPKDNGGKDASGKAIDTSGTWVYDASDPNRNYRRYVYNFYSNGDDNDGTARTTTWAKTENEMIIPEGLDGNGKLSGKTEVKNYFQNIIKSKIELATHHFPSAIHTGTWSFNLVLDGTSDGAMKIYAQDFTHKITDWNDENWTDRGSVSFAKEKIERELGELNPKAFAEELDNLFGGAWAFVFAGGSDFFIDRICFNHEGDLLAELKYKSKLKM
ncbi:hypothetical protein K438DRAFT_1771439 [Mycena galopus ATCC 62051]|nr:hypothetical protein K438DRAFT_1771439 [Mycena galopus ATCC 62051]